MKFAGTSRNRLSKTPAASALSLSMIGYFDEIDSSSWPNKFGHATQHFSKDKTLLGNTERPYFLIHRERTLLGYTE